MGPQQRDYCGRVEPASDQPVAAARTIAMVKFLGHVVDKAGVHPDPEKTAAVREWPIPTTVRESQSRPQRSNTLMPVEMLLFLVPWELTGGERHSKGMKIFSW
ncbi:Retrovirus-related Pol poly from transposon [Labeo rohita]|uniref:Retrovirus-related Pol poly from transposon n=1 Tax=Labeo rohita TaxID=84645 RepID=A0A498NHH8_LABRO|nr:Retrovirus-related Pol poly from transposon [Labeo rohita]